MSGNVKVKTSISKEPKKSEVSGPHARDAECVSVEGGAWRSGVDSNTLMTPRLVIRMIFGDNLLKDEMCPHTVLAVFP